MRSWILAIFVLSLPAFAHAATSEPIGVAIKNRLTKEYLFLRCSADSADCTRVDIVIGSKVKKAAGFTVARILDTNIDRSQMSSTDQVADDVKNAHIYDSEIDVNSLFKKVWAIKNKQKKCIDGIDAEGKAVTLEVEHSKAEKTLRWALTILGTPASLIVDGIRYASEASEYSYHHIQAFLAKRQTRLGYARLDLAQFKGKSVRVSNRTFNQIIDSY